MEENPVLGQNHQFVFFDRQLAYRLACMSRNFLLSESLSVSIALMDLFYWESTVRVRIYRDVLRSQKRIAGMSGNFKTKLSSIWTLVIQLCTTHSVDLFIQLRHSRKKRKRKTKKIQIPKSFLPSWRIQAKALDLGNKNKFQPDYRNCLSENEFLRPEEMFTLRRKNCGKNLKKEKEKTIKSNKERTFETPSHKSADIS